MYMMDYISVKSYFLSDLKIFYNVLMLREYVVAQHNYTIKTKW